MKVAKQEIPDVLLIKPDSFEDSRGFFFESYSKKKYQEFGIDEALLQDNVSFSKRHVLRGLHFQSNNPQGKLVYALQGRVFDVAVDIRRGSPTFKKWVGFELSGENKMQLWIPPGFAHGFCVLSESSLFCYKCSNYYDPGSEISLAWNDPSIGINWPIDNPILSDKDDNLPSIDQIDHSLLPIYEGNTQ